MWLRIHRFPPKAVFLWQGFWLRRLLPHAFQNVRFYRKLWREHGIHEKSVLGARALSELPLVRKGMLADEAPDAVIAGNLPRRYFENAGFTSGSTGEPIRFFRALYGGGSKTLEQKYFDAKQWRALLWDGVSLRTLYRSIKIVELKAGADTLENRLFVPMKDFRGNEKGAAKQIKEFRPDVLAGYSTFVLEVARFLKESNTRIKVPYIVIGGQALKKEEEEIVEEVFSGKLFARYSFEEFRAVAMECSERNGFHIYNESFVFEIVSDFGYQVKEGESGKIVLTDLFNLALPFIRYDTGDYGKFLTGRCACGNRSARLTLDRTANFLFTVGGRTISRGDINFVLGKYSGIIKRYLLERVGKNAFILKIVPGKLFNEQHNDTIRFKERHENKIRLELSSLLGKDVKIDVNIAEELEKNASSGTPLSLFVDRTAR